MKNCQRGRRNDHMDYIFTCQMIMWKCQLIMFKPHHILKIMSTFFSFPLFLFLVIFFFVRTRQKTLMGERITRVSPSTPTSTSSTNFKYASHMPLPSLSLVLLSLYFSRPFIFHCKELRMM